MPPIQVQPNVQSAEDVQFPLHLGTGKHFPFVHLQPSVTAHSSHDNLSHDTHLPFEHPQFSPQSDPFSHGPVQGSPEQVVPIHLHPSICVQLLVAQEPDEHGTHFPFKHPQFGPQSAPVEHALLQGFGVHLPLLQ